MTGLPHIDLAVSDELVDAPANLNALIERAIGQTMKQAKIEIADGAELSMVVCGDQKIRELNREWRQKDKPTNVLSFPGEPDGLLLGDIIISLETTRWEADLENKSFNDHFSHLVVHGFLHLFGYDHETENEASRMESLETEILCELGIADPYHDGSRE